MSQTPISKEDLEHLPAAEVTRIVREVLDYPERLAPWTGRTALEAAVTLLEFLDVLGEPPAYLMVSSEGAATILDCLNAVRLSSNKLPSLQSISLWAKSLVVPVVVCAMPLPSTMVAVGGEALWWGDGSLFISPNGLALTTVNMATLLEQLVGLAGKDAPSGGIKCVCGEWIAGPQPGPLDVVIGGCHLYKNQRCSA